MLLILPSIMSFIINYLSNIPISIWIFSISEFYTFFVHYVNLRNIYCLQGLMNIYWSISPPWIWRSPLYIHTNIMDYFQFHIVQFMIDKPIILDTISNSVLRLLSKAYVSLTRLLRLSILVGSKVRSTKVFKQFSCSQFPLPPGYLSTNDNFYPPNSHSVTVKY